MGRKRIEQDEPQDTDGNGYLKWSDAEIKHDVTPLAEAEPEDTEGQGFKFPDSDVSTADTEGNKRNNNTVSQNESDDTDGNVAKI